MNSSDFLLLLLDAAVKSAIVLLLALGWHRFFPNAAAATRHVVLATTVCACLFLPLLTLGLPTWRLPLLPAPQAPLLISSRPVISPAIPITNVAYAPQFDEFTIEPPVAKGAVESPRSLDGAMIVLALWAIGAWVVFAQVLVGAVLVWLLTYKAQPLANEPWQALLEEVSLSLNFKRKVAIYLSHDAAMPMTTGIFKPLILLPAEALQWSREQLRTVLLHEMAHIKRRDCLTQLLATLNCIVYWFNPLVWIAARQLRTAREQACDDEVLAAGTRASDYASCLVDVAKAVDGANYISPLAVGMACSHLEDRVSSILNPTRQRRVLSRRYVVMTVLLIASLIVPLASFQPFTQAATLPQAQQEKARSAEQKAEAAAQQQAIERHQQEIEQHLRAIEKHQQALTEVQRQEVEQRMREAEIMQESTRSAVAQQRIAAELDRAYAESQRLTGQRAEDAQRKMIEEQLQVEREILGVQQRQARDSALQKQLIEKAQKEAVGQGEAMLRLKRAELEAQLMQLHSRYTDAHPAILEKQHQLEALEQSIEHSIDSHNKSEARSMLMLKRAELEAQLKTLRREYTENHPVIQKMKAQLEALRKELEQLQK